MNGSRRMTVLLRRWSLPLVALLVVGWAGLAQASDSHPIKHGEGRLWRVERGDAPPSHIIGTMHVSDRRVRNLPQPIQEVFQRSEQAAFELRFTPEERQAMLAGTGQSRACRCELAGQLDKKTYARVVARAAEYGLPEKVVARLHPFMLLYIFQMPPEEYRRQLDGDLSLDLYLIQWAYDLGMRVEGLETLEEHLGVLDLIPERDLAEVMREQLDRLDDEPDLHEQLLQDYLAGDMRRVYREFQEGGRARRQRPRVQGSLPGPAQPRHGPAHDPAAGARPGLRRGGRPAHARRGGHPQPAGTPRLPGDPPLLAPAVGFLPPVELSGFTLRAQDVILAP